MLNDTLICPQCGTEIDPQESGGLCVACLLNDALMGGADEGVIGRLGGHELLEMLARGGMGIVYRARKAGSDEEVALKALPGAGLLSEDARQRFHIEAQAMARLTHPTILPVKELGEEDGTPWFTMKLATDGTLAQRLKGYSGKWRETAELIASIAEAVQFAHERGVLHRDLKPGNILFDEAGRPLVSDFGLAKLLDEEMDLTRTIALMGTPNYMAPELTRGGKGAATTACDVWSLGVMLYELLAGHPPFRGDNLATVLRQLNEDAAPTLPRGVPHDLAVITFKCLQKVPMQRYSSAGALAEDLRRWLRGEPVLAQATPLAEHAARWARKHPALVALGCILLLVLTLSALLLAHSNRRLQKALTSEHQLLQQTETHLRDALLAEGEALVRSHDLTSRSRMMSLVEQLVQSGHRGLAVRNLAVQALGKTGVEKVAELPTGFATLSSTLDFSPDLRIYATGQGSRDSTMFRLLDGRSGKVLHEIPSVAEGNNFRFSPDGRHLAARLRDRSLQVHRVDSPREPVFRLPPWRGEWVVPLAFDPGGGWWLYSQRTPEVRRHEAGQTGSQPDPVVFTAPGIVTGLTVSPKGGLLALNWQDGWGVVDIGTGNLLWKRDEQASPCHPAWSPAGDSVLQPLEEDHRLVLAEASTGRTLANLHGHEGRVSEAAFHPELPLAFSIARDRQLIVWDAISGKSLAHHPVMSRGFAIGSDGRQMAFSPAMFGTAIHDLAVPRIWRTWSAPHEPGETAISMDLSPDGRWLVTCSERIARLWDVSHDKHLGDLPPNKARRSVGMVWLEDAVLGTGLHVPHGIRMALRKTAEGAPMPEIESESPLPGEAIYRTGDRKGVLLINKEKGGASLVLDANGGERGRIPTERAINPMDVSADGRWCVADGSRTDQYAVHSMSDGKVAFTYPQKRYLRPFFTPDGSALISSGPREVIVFETGTWRELARWPVQVAYEGMSWAECSPDGRWLAVRHAEGVIALHETAAWQPVVHLRQPGPFSLRSGTMRMTWTADSQRLLVLSIGHRVTEWDMKALREELGRLGLDW